MGCAKSAADAASGSCLGRIGTKRLDSFETGIPSNRHVAKATEKIFQAHMRQAWMAIAVVAQAECLIEIIGIDLRQQPNSS